MAFFRPKSRVISSHAMPYFKNGMDVKRWEASENLEAGLAPVLEEADGPIAGPTCLQVMCSIGILQGFSNSRLKDMDRDADSPFLCSVTTYER